MMAKTLSFVSAAFVAVAIFSSGLAWASQTPGDAPMAHTWAYGNVDFTGNTSSYPALAVDDLGNLHVAYYDETNMDLKYAFKAAGSGAWANETVDSSGMVGREPSIAIDPSGGVNIAYYEETNHYLKYAYRGTGSPGWSLYTVDHDGDVGMRSSIAVDGTGIAHILYFDYTNADLKHAYASPGASSWANETAFTGNVGSGSIPLAIDDTNTLHTSYLDGLNFDMMYMYKEPSGAWSVPVAVDVEGDVGAQGSIAVDAAGGIHMAYSNMDTQELKYAYKSAGAGSWANTTVAQDSNGEITVAVDKSSKNAGVFIAYFNNSQNSMMLASNPSIGGLTGWQTEVVDDYVFGSVGIHSSMAIDGDGGLHLVYYSSNNSSLKYATDTGGAVPEAALPAGTIISLACIVLAVSAYARWRSGK